MGNNSCAVSKVQTNEKRGQNSFPGEQSIHPAHPNNWSAPIVVHANRGAGGPRYPGCQPRARPRSRAWILCQTSALDNQTQASVSRSLEALDATPIEIGRASCRERVEISVDA